MSLAIFHLRFNHAVFSFSIPYKSQRVSTNSLPTVGSHIKPKSHAFTAASTTVPPFFKITQFGLQVADLEATIHLPITSDRVKFLHV
jgi:hypothetical protein